MITKSLTVSLDEKKSNSSKSEEGHTILKDLEISERSKNLAKTNSKNKVLDFKENSQIKNKFGEKSDVKLIRNSGEYTNFDSIFKNFRPNNNQNQNYLAFENNQFSKSKNLHYNYTKSLDFDFMKEINIFKSIYIILFYK